MTSITFFFFLIPVLAILLLAINFLFATHSPYQEKNSVFECGFHSFLGQNRMQFNISFYIFGLLFLLFDLEILLIYPYPVSAQFNSLYGLCIMLIFFLILTLGFAFELGKNALKIDSRQYNDNNPVYKSNKTLQAGLINFKVIFKYILLPLFVYFYIQFFIFSPIYLAGPGEEEPIDIEYLKDLIYTVQELIKEKGLNKPLLELTNEQHLAKAEAQEYIRGCIRDLNALRQEAINDLSKVAEADWLTEAVKRTAEADLAAEAAKRTAEVAEAAKRTAEAAAEAAEVAEIPEADWIKAAKRTAEAAEVAKRAEESWIAESLQRTAEAAERAKRTAEAAEAAEALKRAAEAAEAAKVAEVDWLTEAVKRTAEALGDNTHQASQEDINNIFKKS